MAAASPAVTDMAAANEAAARADDASGSETDSASVTASDPVAPQATARRPPLGGASSFSAAPAAAPDASAASPDASAASPDETAAELGGVRRSSGMGGVTVLSAP